ncbi:hypothetical protein RHSIM_Rhsim10G0206900 [Rhododendron simsii]|uniref:Cystatin domain-containing protein n=1 Tax=Rhododendron simsii TaxID=118357 RepID=A0A834L980_RHOSS|nr:hypothetical protein RHSIM_Rhsim10G0206900 [Rhododendron simsii]
MAKEAAYASELPFYVPTGPIVSGPLFEKASDVPPSSTTANKPSFASELPFYVPTGRILSGQLFNEVYEEDVPPITTANNPPPPSTTPETDPLSYRSLLPPEPLSSSSSYSPFGFYGAIDVNPMIEAYNNMPDYPNKPPKPTKKPRFSIVPYVLPSPEVPRIRVRNFTNEEREIYNKMVFESDGFDCPYVPPEIAIPGILKPVKVEQLKGLEDMADLALKHYNAQNNTSYQFVKVIKANMRWDGGSTYNITFQAKDNTTCSPPRNFQARVTKFMDNTKVLFCRVEQVSIPPGGTNCFRDIIQEVNMGASQKSMPMDPSLVYEQATLQSKSGLGGAEMQKSQLSISYFTAMQLGELVHE